MQIFPKGEMLKLSFFLKPHGRKLGARSLGKEPSAGWFWKGKKNSIPCRKELLVHFRGEDTENEEEG